MIAYSAPSLVHAETSEPDYVSTERVDYKTGRAFDAVHPLDARGVADALKRIHDALNGCSTARRRSLLELPIQASNFSRIAKTL